MISLFLMDRSTRVSFYAVLAFAGSFLLGESYLPTLGYFWGLGVGRVLLGLLLVLVPGTNAGRYRPVLVLLSAACLLVSTIAAPLIFTRWFLVTLLYLALEVALDALVLAQTTEQEAPLELGVLAVFRLLGLWAGLFLQYSTVSMGASPDTLAAGFLVMLTAFWLLAKESRKGLFVPRRLESRPPVRERLPAQLKHLTEPWLLLSGAVLLCYAYLAGFHSKAVLPYPLIHPSAAGSWMNGIVENSQVLGVGLLGTVLLERFRLRIQVMLAAFLAWGVLLGDLHSAFPHWGFGLLLTGILLSTRAVIRESLELDSVLKAVLVVTVWTAGGLTGQIGAESRFPSAVSFALAVIVLLQAPFAWRRYSRAARKVLTAIPPALGEARFGDRTQDFHAAPAPGRNKKSPPGKWKGRWNYFLLHLPLYATCLALLFIGLNSATYISHNKSSWQKQLEDTSRRFQTELFFSSFSRRLTEEMLAGRRVPRDWAQFISQSFNSNGTPLTDVDFWGTAYRIESSPSEVVIQSAGPDKIFGTRDDLERTVARPQGVTN